MELATHKLRTEECVGIAQAVRFLGSSAGRLEKASAETVAHDLRARYARLMEAVSAYAAGQDAAVEREAIRRYVARTANDYPGLAEAVWKS